MPRMSDAEKQKSRGRILDAAARMLRAQGVEATSVADVMKAAGMTHGGFYRHFVSKEDLVAAAVDRAADSVLKPIEAGKEAGDRQAVAGYVTDYLSDAHRRNRESGCPLAAIAGEVLRDQGAARDATEKAARRTARLLSTASEAPDGGEVADDLGLATLSVLVGTIVLARLLVDDREAEHLLELGQSTVELLHDHFEKKITQVSR